MKLALPDELETNVSNVVQFKTTENSAKLFSMLSSALYSNKEFCVLHEISSNALDAHALVGKSELPIRVTLPTSLDPTVSITDFGPGLSDVDVVRLLTTYGESTKQASDEFIGGWGIGSKSPAAVTNTWTITSRFAGRETDYLVFIDGTGVPTLTKIREVQCLETGITVKIPVQTHRVSVWQGVVPSVYQHYPVLPELINYNRSGVNKAAFYPIPGFEKSGTYASQYGGPMVIISSREYKLDPAILKAELTDREIGAVIGASLMHYFDIGELDLSISRESLQYTKKTINAISKRFRALFDHVEYKLSCVVKSTDDPLEFRHAATKFIDTFISRKECAPFLFSEALKKACSKKFPDILDCSYLTKIAAPHKGLGRGRKVPVPVGSRIYMKRSWTARVRSLSYNSNNSSGGNSFFTVSGDKWDAAAEEYEEYCLVFDTAHLSKVIFYRADCKDAKSRLGYNFNDSKNQQIAILFENPQLPAYLQNKVINASTLPKAPRATKTKQSLAAKEIVMRVGAWRQSRYVGRRHKESHTVELEKFNSSDPLRSNISYLVVDNYVSLEGSAEDSAALSCVKYFLDNVDSSAPVSVIYVKKTDKRAMEFVTEMNVPPLRTWLINKYHSVANSDAMKRYYLVRVANHLEETAFKWHDEAHLPIDGATEWNAFLAKYQANLCRRWSYSERHNDVNAAARVFDFGNKLGLTPAENCVTIAEDLENMFKVYPMLKYIRSAPCSVIREYVTAAAAFNCNTSKGE